MYKAITHGIEVIARPEFLPERSRPDENSYFWTYRITIRNTGDRAVKLISRYWKITDENGHVEEVRGAGVVGEQPQIAPGEGFEYVSGCPLPTPSGIMEGAYFMTDANGREFAVAIPVFSLDVPGRVRMLS